MTTTTELMHADFLTYMCTPAPCSEQTLQYLSCDWVMLKQAGLPSESLQTSDASQAHSPANLRWQKVTCKTWWVQLHQAVACCHLPALAHGPSASVYVARPSQYQKLHAGPPTNLPMICWAALAVCLQSRLCAWLHDQMSIEQSSPLCL